MKVSKHLSAFSSSQGFHVAPYTKHYKEKKNIPMASQTLLIQV